MLFINVAFGIALVSFEAGSLMLAGVAMARLSPISITSIRCAGAVGLLAILAVLLVRVRRHEPVTVGRFSIEMPSVTITFLQLLASSIDLAAAAAAFWILLPHSELDFFGVVIACAIGILLFAFRDVAYRREIWWQFEFDAQASRSLRAILVASILALGISL